MRRIAWKSESDGDARHPMGNRIPKRGANILWAAVLALAVSGPGLFYQLSKSVNAIAWVKYLNATLLVAIVAGGILLMAYGLLGRDFEKALRLTAATTFVVFLWPLFARFDVLPGPFGALLVVSVPVLIVRASFLHGDRFRVGPLMLGLALFIFATYVFGVSTRTVAQPAIVTFSDSRIDAVSNRPDVLFVLLDGYAREDVLSEMYGFDNAPFLGELKRLGFNINDSASANYDRTYASVASMMDLGYPIESGVTTSEQHSIVRGLLGQSGSLVNAFKRAGYEVTYSENGWSGSRCGQIVDRCWRSGTTLMNAYALSLLTPIAPLVERLVAHPTNAISWVQMSNLADVFIQQSSRDRPQMVWMHITLPHPPVRLDRSCVPQRDSWRNGQALTFGAPEDELRRDAYVDQTVCVNTTITQQLGSILDALPDTAVFLFSDHGPDGSKQLTMSPEDLTVMQIRERLGILLAVRESGTCSQSYGGNTLLTATRAFTACTLGVDLEPMEERAFLVPAQEESVPVVETEPVSRP